MKRFDAVRRRSRRFRDSEGWLIHRDSPETREISACFTGHRRLTQEKLPGLTLRLDRVLEALYRRGFRRFFTGGALGFDTLAAQRVLNLQTRFPDVRLILSLPCGDQSRSWQIRDQYEWLRLRYAADEVRILAPAYYPGCMQVRNRYMVERSAICVCCLSHMKNSGTASTVAYALQQEIPVLNLAMEDACAAFCSETEGER